MANEQTKERFKELETLARAAGLKHYDIQFFEVPSSVIYEVASYGLPTRYSHWSFGRVYQYQKTQGEMGFSKIYELILNNDPAYAFLDTTNTETINLMIAAHCMGHSDFFANNVMFRHADETNMVQVAKRHAEAIDQYRKDYGDDEVDEWLDVALALERHIDIYKKLERSRYPQRHIEFKERAVGEFEDLVPDPEPLVKKVVEGTHLPPQPEKDLLWFLSEYANLERWQKHIFEIVRRESYYFYPQYRTKIMNEGWACLVGDSYVQTSRGYRKFSDIMSDMPGEPLTVVTGILGEDKVMQLQPISDFHETEPQVTTKIMTSKGISFEGAHDHKVIAAKNVCGESIIDDTNLADLEIGDFVKMPIGQNVWASELVKCDFDYPKHSRSKDFDLPNEINADVARFLGFFLSEGCTVKRGVQITNKDKVLIESFCSVQTNMIVLFGAQLWFGFLSI
jgi:stage V sporulation protein R